MPETSFTVLMGSGQAGLGWTGNLTAILIAVTETPPGVTRYPAPDAERFLHIGWIAPAFVTSWSLHDEEIFTHVPIWLEHARAGHYFPSPGPYSNVLVYQLLPGVSCDVLVIA
jgi:hypothetical protein